MSTDETNISLCSPRPSSGQNPNIPVLVVSAKPLDCPSNHVLIKVDRFGFSANNVTYQALAEHPHFRYFDFHPAPECKASSVSPKTHGLIPVWGFGTIAKSSHPKIQDGERVYGYFAPARYLLVSLSSSEVTKFSFYVSRPHLPADRRPYNQILRCSADPQYISTSTAEDITMLYRPLFWTSYWCEDWIHCSNYRAGVSHILVSSASSKTAFCLAYLIGKRIRRAEISENTNIIGLTSKGNVDFTKRLELYHEVLDYDSFTSTHSFQGGKDSRWLYVDVAGNEKLNKRINEHFASPYTGKLVANIVLGLTNLQPSTANTTPKKLGTNPFNVSGTSDTTNTSTSAFWPREEFFFMPEWLDIRRHQIPVLEIFRLQNQAWKELMEDCTGWVELKRVYGATGVEEAYRKLSKEGLGPDKGLIWSLWDGDTTKPLSLSSKL